jgi:hypothetical protein
MCGCGEREILQIVITITIFSQSIPFTGEPLWCRNSFRTPQNSNPTSLTTNVFQGRLQGFFPLLSRLVHPVQEPLSRYWSPYGSESPPRRHFGSKAKQKYKGLCDICGRSKIARRSFPRRPDRLANLRPGSRVSADVIIMLNTTRR